MAFNYSMNEFALFGNAKGKRVRLWTAERTSKYLLSFNYIPANFNAILTGPSLSDNIDPGKIGGYNFYNLSQEGANVKSLKPSLLNVLERGRIRYMIICVHPYMTRDSFLKDRRLTPEIYWSTLGSTFTFKFYADKVKKLSKPATDSFTESYNGYIRPIQKVASVEAAIDDFASKPKDVNPVDPGAYEDLKAILAEARRKGVKIIAYYHPDPLKVYESFGESYRQYQQKMKGVFMADDVIIDFNTSEYDSFRTDPRNYIDHGHLSSRGADILAAEFSRVIRQLDADRAKNTGVTEHK